MHGKEDAHISQPFKAEASPTNIEESGPYHKENTTFTVTKVSWLMLFE
jgi:hypothetical protein